MLDSAEYEVDLSIPIRKMKPKRTYAAGVKEPSPIDSCETPRYALDPLVQYISRSKAIWEPAAGSGRMVRHLESFGYRVLGSTIDNGANFFDVTCDGCDMIVTNPPYGIKFQWIERCYDLGLPFALLLPVETIGAKRCQAAMKRYGAEILLLNRRINFKMPNKGFEGSAQFPTLWFCHGILPAPICYGDITYYEEPEFDPISDVVKA
jgi:hypothetical protein